MRDAAGRLVGVALLGAGLLVALTACGRVGFDPARGDAATDASPGCTADAAPVTGPAYYVGPSGADTNPGTSRDAPWATFSHALATIAPGDTLLILDGTYTESLTVMRSGTPDAPITIRAEHDGRVVIDGQTARHPCDFRGASSTSRVSDLVVEGLACRNPPATAQNGEAAVLVYFADRVTVRRSTGSGADDVQIEVSEASNVLLEDVAALGPAGTGLSVLSSQRVTVRRAYVRWQATGGDGTAFAITESSDGVFENNYVVVVPGTPGGWLGFNVFSTSQPADRNRLLGNVVIGTGIDTAYFVAGNSVDITSNRLVDNVAVMDSTSGYGVFQRGDIDLGVTRFTSVGSAAGIHQFPQSTNNLRLALDSTVVVNTQVGLETVSDPRVLGFTHDHDVFFNVPTLYNGTSAGASEQTLDPGYDTARYGTGAYLVRPPAVAALGAGGPAGAEIIYRTVDGVLTTLPLWPWPMDARIAAEAGVSPTAELWTTLPTQSPSCRPIERSAPTPVLSFGERPPT